MAYATLQDLIVRFGEDQVLLAADRDDDGTVDQDVVDVALDDATAEIDTYLAEVYTLPLATVPTVLTRLCADVAMHRLSPEADVATEGRRTRYEQAVSILKKLASRQISLGLPATPSTRIKPSITSKRRRWTGRGVM